MEKILLIDTEYISRRYPESPAEPCQINATDLILAVEQFIMIYESHRAELVMLNCSDMYATISEEYTACLFRELVRHGTERRKITISADVCDGVMTVTAPVRKSIKRSTVDEIFSLSRLAGFTPSRDGELLTFSLTLEVPSSLKFNARGASDIDRALNDMFFGSPPENIEIFEGNYRI